MTCIQRSANEFRKIPFERNSFNKITESSHSETKPFEKHKLHGIRTRWSNRAHNYLSRNSKPIFIFILWNLVLWTIFRECQSISRSYFYDQQAQLNSFAGVNVMIHQPILLSRQRRPRLHALFCLQYM